MKYPVNQGYRKYHGRRSRGKTALAVLLVLVILASVGFIFVQEKILVFDETGKSYFRLPGRQTEEEVLPKEEIDLTIETVPEKEIEQEVWTVRGILTPVPLDRENGSLAAREARELFGEDAAVAVTLKDSAGTVYFDSDSALPGTVRFLEEDTDVALNAVLSRGSHTIARISCFHDPKAANREVESMGLKNTGGFIFYDGNNSQWLDPAKPAAREYLRALACEAAAMGFDEIMLTDFSYPTEGKLDKIAYGEVDREETLSSFLMELRTALESYSVMLSVEIPEQVILHGGDEAAGLHLGMLADLVDCIYAETAPERAETLKTAVEEVGTAVFVPILEAYSEEMAGNCLIMQ